VKGVTEHRKNYPQQVLLVSFVRVTESVLVSLPTLPAGPLYRVAAARKVTDLFTNHNITWLWAGGELCMRTCPLFF
jgi:hypothetical protein